MGKKIFISAIVCLIITACASIPELPELQLEPGQTETFGNMEFVSIPGGAFPMGSPPDEEGRNYKFIKVEQRRGNVVTMIDKKIDIEKLRPVRVYSFWMGKYEVTRKQYMDIMGTMHKQDSLNQVKGDNLPVVKISWYEAVEFCNKMSEKYGLKPYYIIHKNSIDRYNESRYDRKKWRVLIAGGNGFRLPTEAEWEYACRAGTRTAFHYGDTIDRSMVNFDPTNNRYTMHDESKRYRIELKLVGSFKPNAYGLYDMHGNVSEWCWDWYEHSPSRYFNPIGAWRGEFRVYRGGSYDNQESSNQISYLRSAARACTEPDSDYHNIGLRLVRSSVQLHAQ